MADTRDTSPNAAAHAAAAAAPPAPLLPSAATTRRLTLVKGEHRWRFRWDAGDEPALINHIAQMARDGRVPFDWFDAAVVCQQIAQPKGVDHTLGHDPSLS